jgi:hypothetical protein
MKTDYPELEGKEFEFVCTDGEVKIGKVIGVSYHIGITAIYKCNPNVKCICLNKRLNMHLYKFTYRQAFHDIVRRLQSGRYDVGAARAKRGSPGGQGNQNCAFV